MPVGSNYVPSVQLHNRLLERNRARRRSYKQTPKTSRLRTNQTKKRTTAEGRSEAQQHESKTSKNETSPQPVAEDLQIRPVETSKDKIKQPPLAEHKLMYIPPIGSSVLICGKSGSGKSTLLQNFLTEERFYKDYFDKTFLISPTANGDDVQRSMNIDPKYVCTDLDEAPEFIETILNAQQQKLDKSSADKVPQYCIIFDDVIGNTKFMNEKAFTRCFYQVRHVNCTTFICTQHFKRVPRVCRLQANFVFFFEGSQTEVDTVAEEFAPPNVHPDTFKTIVTNATSEDYSFLTINMKVPPRIRFRQRLDNFINIENYADNSIQLNEQNVGRETPEHTTEVRAGEPPGEGAPQGRDVAPHR